MHHSPVDWSSVCDDLKSKFRDSGEGDLQKRIDSLWDTFLIAAKREIVACHEILDGTEGSLRTGNTKLGHPQSFRPPKISDPPPDPSDCLHKLLDFLVRKTQGLPVLGFDPNDLVSLVADLLELPTDTVDAWLVSPWDGVEGLRHEIVLFRNRGTQRALRQWRSRFTQNGFHPSRALFAWLRGKRVRPSLEGRTCLGHFDFFRALRSFWEGINRAQPASDSTALKEWLESRAFVQDSPSQDVQALRSALKGMSVRSAAGMDAWSVKSVRLLSDGALKALTVIYDIVETTSIWPSPLVRVRVQVIPKDGYTEPLASSLRPISIFSVWYRLWGKYRLSCLPPEIIDNLDQGQCGGIPGRDPGPQMASLLSEVELSLRDPEAQPLYVLCLDASKCFDRIPHHIALNTAEKHNVPIAFLRALGGFYNVCQRHFSASGKIDSIPSHPTNGLGQGCAFSALLTNLCVHEWCQEIREAGCCPQAAVDDRVIKARTKEDLMRAAAVSESWDDRNRWKINPDKCALLSAPHDESIRVSMQGIDIPHRRFVKLLGATVATGYLQGRQLQKTRTAKAMNTARRLEIAKVDVRVAQEATSMAVTTQLVHGVLPYPIPKDQLHPLTMSIKRACGLYRKRHSWAALCAGVIKAHSVDPELASAYCHCRSMLRALRVLPSLRELWLRFESLEPGKTPRGPLATTCFYFRLLGVMLYSDGWNLELSCQAGVLVHLLDCPWTLVTHTLRKALRFTAMQDAESRRRNLLGLSDCDLEASRECLTRVSHVPFRAELVGLMSDALWTQDLKKHLRDSSNTQGTCPWCPEQVEDVRHVFYSCPKWEHLRVLEGGVNLSSLLHLNPASYLCGWCPRPSTLELPWFVYQLALARIWRVRTDAVAVPEVTLNVQGNHEGEIADELRIPALPQNFGPTRHVNFSLTYHMSSARAVWPFHQTQFHKIVHFLTRLRWGPPETTPQCSFLELLLSFVLSNSGCRFYTEIPEAQNGHWVSVQLEQFKLAMRTAQTILHAPAIVPATAEFGLVYWFKKLGLPPQSALCPGIILPHWQEVRDLLFSFPISIARHYSQDLSRGVDLWRRWDPGLHESQCVLSLSCPGYRGVIDQLTGHPLHLSHTFRICRSQRIEWKLDLYRAREFRARLLLCPAFHVSILGESLQSRIEAHGVISHSDLRALAVSWGAGICSRLRLLESHLDYAVSHNCHVVIDPFRGRMLCALCGTAGYTSFKSAWLRQSCTCSYLLSVSSTLVEFRDQLSAHRTLMRELSRAISGLLKQLR
eukprot:6473726-Amphidinium_carterae.1